VFPAGWRECRGAGKEEQGGEGCGEGEVGVLHGVVLHPQAHSRCIAPLPAGGGVVKGEKKLVTFINSVEEDEENEKDNDEEKDE